MEKNKNRKNTPGKSETEQQGHKQITPLPVYQQKHPAFPLDKNDKVVNSNQEHEDGTTEETDGGTPAGFVSKETVNKTLKANTKEGSE